MPRELNDPTERVRLGLPKGVNEKAFYVIELNLQKNGGLAAAEGQGRHQGTLHLSDLARL